MSIDIHSQETVLKTFPFTVEKLRIKRNGQLLDHVYHRLRCPDWVNILPITSDGQAILIKQSRVGSLSTTLEIPGGVVDQGEEKDPTLAAIRELEEETGYTTQKILSLGSFLPNPAIQDNKVHFFIALNCELNTRRRHFPDHLEDIQVVLTPSHQLSELVRLGQINHSLCGLCIQLSRKYVDIGE